MIEIKNINKIVGLSANGRTIIAAGDYTDSLRKTGNEMFVFKIQKIGDGKEYNREISIVLQKGPSPNGLYYMFNMGLENATGIYVEKEWIKNPVELATQIKEVLRKTEHWHQTK